MSNLSFVCRADNDLYRVLSDLGGAYPRYPSLAEAVSAAPAGSGVLALADAYTRATLEVGPQLLEAAAAKDLRLYLEYPAALPGVALGEPRPAVWERAVVAGDGLAPALAAGRILDLHTCWFLPVAPRPAHLVLARVAGYHTAVYGLPAEAYPALFPLGSGETLIAATKLSQFVTARYGPTAAWQALWERLLRWLASDDPVPPLRWQPAVGLRAARDEALPDTVEAEAFARSVAWFRSYGVYSIDQKKGVIEGYESAIDEQGRQMQRTWPRGDCIGESTMPFILDWLVNRNPASKRLAGQMLDYVCFSPDFREQDPASPTYGLSKWSPDTPVFYGQENASIILPALLAGRMLGDDRWDERILQLLLANLRTTGKLGFRRNALRRGDFPAGPEGWRPLQEAGPTIYAPHYQASLWAAYLWAYGLTGYGGFFDAAKQAIGMTMSAYPDRWIWTNGLTQELARMLLPLAFLVRLEDTAEHRAWLRRMADDLLAYMQPCGAIREGLGPLENGKYPPPRSNETYGTDESSLLQEDGDPVCDLLYTADFALIGLHEAAAATGEALYREAEDRLMQFLCRIQVRSSAHPYLDGAWLRGFDYELWEYWASSSDQGWGAWCVESGWTNAWIAAVLGLRLAGQSLWDLSTASRLQALLPKWLAEMGLA